MINRILDIFCSEVIRLTTYDSKRFFTSFNHVRRAGDGLINNPTEETFGGIVDNRQSYGYIRLIDEKVLFTQANQNRQSCANIKTQEVILPVRVVIVSPQSEADTLYQGMLEVFSNLDFKNLGYQSKNLKDIYGIPYPISIIPKAFYPRTEQVAKLENPEDFRWSEDWTYVAFDLDLTYIPDFTNQCTTLCAECERTLPAQGTVIFDVGQFTTIDSIVLTDLVDNTFCYQVSPDSWIFDNTKTITENLTTWASQINGGSSSDVIAEVVDMSKLVITFTNPTLNCCGRILNFIVNDGVNNFNLTAQVTCE